MAKLSEQRDKQSFNSAGRLQYDREGQETATDRVGAPTEPSSHMNEPIHALGLYIKPNRLSQIEK